MLGARARGFPSCFTLVSFRRISRHLSIRVRLYVYVLRCTAVLYTKLLTVTFGLACHILILNIIVMPRTCVQFVKVEDK